ncbi:GGDEF domain-containing protein [Photobacterium sp. DNB23_23_1]
MDSFTLDIRTLNFIIILFSCIYSAGFLLYQRSQKKISGLGLFALSLLFIGIGPLVLSFRGTTSNWLSIIIANAIIMLGFQLVLHSLCLFRKSSLKYTYFTYACYPLSISLFYYYSHIVPSIKARVIVISVFVAISTIITAIATLNGKQKDLKIAVWMMSSSLFLYGTFMVFRATWSALSEEIHNFMYAGLLHQLTFLFSILLVVAMSFSMLWMINARLVRSIREVSRRDPLTQLYNRHALERVLPRILVESHKAMSLSIIMTDIDNFKSINDKHGHLVGDKALIRVAKVINTVTRPCHFVFRFGGDEILIILPNSHLEEANILAESLRKSIFTCGLVDNIKLPLTSSFGVASLRDGESWESLVSRADQALYHAKKLGRNTVVTSPQHMEPRKIHQVAPCDKAIS